MKDKLKRWIKKLPAFFYGLLLLALLVMFFTNDFGLVDIHKTTVVMTLGIDAEEEDLVVTAQLTVPEEADSSGAASLTEIVGKGKTVAEALNEINSKTGFYPKLLFLQMIILGDSCKQDNIFRMLDYFYRNENAQYTALVAMCSGKAGDLLTASTPASDVSADSLKRILSDELEKSANVSAVNLKLLAEQQYSKSNACFMPYIEVAPQGSTSGGGTEGNNGAPPEGSSGGSSEEGGQEGGESPSEGQGGGPSQSGQGAKGGSGGEPKELTCRKTAVFRNGNFVGILNEEQAFALNIVKCNVRHLIVSATADGTDYAVGLKNNDGGVKIEMEKEIPVLTFSFSGKAQIQDASEAADPNAHAQNDITKDSVLKAAADSIKKAMAGLADFCVQNDCDVLGAKDLLYKYERKYYDKFKDDLLAKMRIAYDVRLVSAR